MTSDIAPKNRRPVSPQPAYQAIEMDIRRKIRDGSLPAGTMLAGRHNLARQYGVSLSTIQQSIANLIADGTLESIDRRGTFVAQPRPAPEIETAAQDGLAVVNAEGHGSAHTGRSAPVVPPLERTSATLGIIGTAPICVETAWDTGSLWTRLAVRSLESVFSAAGGTTHYFDRYPAQAARTGEFNDADAVPIAEAIAALRAQGAEALAFVGLTDPLDLSEEILSAVDVEQVPTVCLSWHEVRPPLAQVFYDSRFAGYQAAQHLLRRGYRRLLFLAPCTAPWLEERIRAAQEAVRHAGLPPEALLVYPAQRPSRGYDRKHSGEWVYAAACQALIDHRVFSGAEAGCSWGLIAPNDRSAYGVLQAASEAGKIAGQDFGLIGFDDDTRAYSVGLTTVRPPIEAMGEEAGRLLLRALQGENSGLQVRLRSQVIPRASTSPRQERGS